MKRDWTSRTSLLLVGLILLLVNLIGLNFFFRVDLTDDDVYTLSDASVRMVESLDDPITFKVFFTQNLRPPFSSNLRFLQDKLDDYRAYGGQLIQYEFVDPADDDELRDEAARYGIPPVQIQVVENDNVQIKNAYMGLAIQYGDEREVIPVIQDLATLEYDITSAIQKLTRDRTPVVGFLSGHGEPTPSSDMPTLYQQLQRNYDVKTVTVAEGALDPSPDVLMVIAPSDSLPADHLKALDAYVQNGGKVGWLLNRVGVQLQMGQASELTTGLESLLSTYGIVIAPNLVMDRRSSTISIPRNLGGFRIFQQIQYPFLPIAGWYNPDNLMVNRLPETVYYFISAIDTTAARPPGVRVDPLVASSPESGVQQGFFFIQPVQQPGPLEGGPYVLAAAYSGTFPSAYAPDVISPETRMVVVGDGDFVNASVMQSEVPANVQFVLNMVDWLAQDDALLSIRTKTVENRPLEEVGEHTRSFFKYFNMIGPALLVLLFGLIRWRVRKNRQIVLTR